MNANRRSFNFIVGELSKEEVELRLRYLSLRARFACVSSLALRIYLH